MTVTDAARRAGATRASSPGGRNRLRKLARRLRIAIGLVVLLAGVAYGSYPPFRDAVNSRVDSVKSSVADKVDKRFVPERPVSVSANLRTPRHPAAHAADGFLNTFWAAPFAISNYPTLTLKFDHRVTLTRLILNSGAKANFTGHGRPSLLVLVFSNKQSTTLTPTDTPKAQTLNINRAIAITSVRISVQGVFPGPQRDVALSNLELFGVG